MVIASIKKLESILEMVSGYNNILVVGCGGCASVCLAGGQKEVDAMCAQITLSAKAAGSSVTATGFVVERQCEIPFLAELDEKIKPFNALLSMSCGAGVQFLAERFPDKPVFPAIDTVFTGVNRDIGWYEEKCKNCGDCVLGITGGICPVAMCAKSLFNGPCGGPQDGHCEVDKEVPCAWIQIHERLKKQGRLDNILSVFPAREWQDQVQGTLVLEPYKKKFAKSEK